MARAPLPPTSASSFLRAAIGHHEAAHHVQNTIRDASGTFNARFLAYYNLIGFAIELYFKSFLSNNGYSVEQLAGLGHRLGDLLTAARSRSLFSYPGRGDVDPSALARIVDIVGPHFSTMTYRYINDASDRYTFIENVELVDPILIDLRLRIEQSGVSVLVT